MKIYHNPRCTKSREALSYLEEKGEKLEVKLYLKESLDKEELTKLLKKLKIPAEDLIRKGEKIYKAEFAGKKMTEKKWIAAMVKYPVLMQRPIIVKGRKAVIGRPLDNVVEAFF